MRANIKRRQTTREVATHEEARADGSCLSVPAVNRQTSEGGREWAKGAGSAFLPCFRRVFFVLVREKRETFKKSAKTSKNRQKSWTRKNPHRMFIERS